MADPSKPPRKPPDAACASPANAGVFMKCFYQSWAGVVDDLTNKERSGWSHDDGNFVWWCFRRNDRLMFMGVLVCALVIVVMLLSVGAVYLLPRRATRYNEPHHPYAEP